LVLRAGLGVALLPGPLATAAAAPLPRCEDPRVKDAFKRGVEYCSTDPARAVVELEQAAYCEPVGDAGRRVPLGFAGDVAYQPHFWLALAYLREERIERAVGPYELWSCAPEGEKERPPAVTAELEGQLPAQAESARPTRFVDYEEGLAAAKRKQWDAAVTSFCKALRAWDEDREVVREQGRWVVRYRPRERLGRSLARLGCRDAALALLQRSSRLQCRDVEPEKDWESLGILLETLELETRSGAAEPELCRRFECCLEVWEDQASCPRP
jgi:hypothetical protein